MSKKKKHAEHANHERWLVSYADFITLLFAFFVVLFSSSQVDRSKSNKMALAIEAAFDHFSLFKDQAGELNVMGGEGTPSTSQVSSIRESASKNGETLVIVPELADGDQNDGILVKPKGDKRLRDQYGLLTTEEILIARTQRKIMDVLEKKKMTGTAVVVQDDSGLIIRLQNAGIFETGADKMTPESYDLLKSVGGLISGMPNQIRVEGHTDNQLPGKYGSNWELSSARASYVARWLIQEEHLDPKRVSVTGYGEYRPIADNATPEGRMKNRRVDIIVLSKQAAKNEAPLQEPAR